MKMHATAAEDAFDLPCLDEVTKTGLSLSTKTIAGISKWQTSQM
jgi:hypothetical protein